MHDRHTANRVLLALSDSDFQSIWGHLEPIELERGQTIYRDGDPVSHLYFVDRGLISRVKSMVNVKMVKIGVPFSKSIVQIPGKAF